MVGTSLNVYPAAGLINYAPAKIPKYLVDPNINANGIKEVANLTLIQEKATEGVHALVKTLLAY